MRYLPKRSKQRYLKDEALQVPQEVRTVLVRYLLLGIRILVYSCTGCGSSKIYLCLKGNRSSFSWVGLIFRNWGHTSMNSHSLLVAKDLIFGKQNLTPNKLKMNKFMFNVKHLKLNKFIKYIWQLIISNSNATLEVNLLHLWILIFRTRETIY